MARGQVFLVETIVAIATALLIAVIALHTFTSISNYRSGPDRAAAAVERAASALVLSQGDPANWNTVNGTVRSLGVASRPGVIDSYKLAALSSQNYTELLSLSPYRARISILKDGNVIWSMGSVNETETVVIAERLCIYNSSPSLLRVEASK